MIILCLVLHSNASEREWNHFENWTLSSVLSSPLSPEPDQQSSSPFTIIHKKTELNQTFPPLAAELIQVHGELYMSETFIEAYNSLQEQASELGCNLPMVVIGLMFASNGTQLTSFSTTKLWPVYLAIGN